VPSDNERFREEPGELLRVGDIRFATLDLTYDEIKNPRIRMVAPPYSSDSENKYRKTAYQKGL